MYHAYNVIKFLTNDPTCQMAGIIDDIKQTVADYKSYKQNDAIYKFVSAFSSYIAMKQQDAIRFASMMMNDNVPIEYQQIMEYYYLPFRYSKNPLADKALIEGMFNIDNLRLDSAILSLLGNYDFQHFNGNQDFLDRMYFFFNYMPLSFEDIGRTPRVGWIDERIPYDEMIIRSEFAEAINNPNHPRFAKMIGNYGELMFYNFLIYDPDIPQQVLWVSRDLGDGFGYDFAVYDYIENRLALYEVKTTTREENLYNTELNEHESRICNLMRDAQDTDYHVVKVLVGNQFQIIDINDKTEETHDVYNNKKVRLLKKTSDKNNTYTIEKN